jgi:uncharacterized protein (DUF1697 family)
LTCCWRPDDFRDRPANEVRGRAVNTYVALLRAINVGGTGKLAMTDLRVLCQKCGFQNVATYIQSGNVVFRSKLSEAGAKAAVEEALARKMGKPFGALLRTASELSGVVDANPFPQAAPNRILILFLDEAPPADSLKAVVAPGREELALRGREIFIHFPDGMGQSKLKVPFQKVGTGRNLNTATKLAAMARNIAAVA